LTPFAASARHEPAAGGPFSAAEANANASAPGAPTIAEVAAPGQTATAAATAPEGPQAPILGYGVGLQQAIETVQATIELAARQGLAQARIALSPAELGEIRIHLTQTANGLFARVTAGTQAAAQALADGHVELRQSLHSLGLAELRMDVGAFGEPGAHGRESGPGRFSAGEGASHRTAPGETFGEPDDTASTGGEPAARATKPSRGALIDVLA
jgi:flagellar hook-length control protein FliK